MEEQTKQYIVIYSDNTILRTAIVNAVDIFEAHNIVRKSNITTGKYNIEILDTKKKLIIL